MIYYSICAFVGVFWSLCGHFVLGVYLVNSKARLFFFFFSPLNQNIFLLKAETNPAIFNMITDFFHLFFILCFLFSRCYHFPSTFLFL